MHCLPSTAVPASLSGKTSSLRARAWLLIRIRAICYDGRANSDGIVPMLKVQGNFMHFMAIGQSHRCTCIQTPTSRTIKAPLHDGQYMLSKCSRVSAGWYGWPFIYICKKQMIEQTIAASFFYYFCPVWKRTIEGKRDWKKRIKIYQVFFCFQMTMIWILIFL